jgi:hypothetical protein
MPSNACFYPPDATSPVDGFLPHSCTVKRCPYGRVPASKLTRAPPEWTQVASSRTRDCVYADAEKTFKNIFYFIFSSSAQTLVLFARTWNFFFKLKNSPLCGHGNRNFKKNKYKKIKLFFPPCVR